MSKSNMNRYRDFYTEKYASGEYPGGTGSIYSESIDDLRMFLSKYDVEHRNSKCLEIGSGKGALQDIVTDYTGLDYSESVQVYYHKPFFSASATDLPFEDNSYDYIWSRAVWEHIQEPEKALNEAMRVLKSGGVFFFSPAWHCRPWAANGYLVRPYSDFNIWGKIYKFMIPFFNSVPYRTVVLFIRRMFWLLVFIFSDKESFRLPYRKLKPNYEVFWQSDSDACCDLDPFLTILWCKSKGYSVPSHDGFLKQFLSRHEAIEIRKN